jgi:UDP-N-acetylglucosamine acyltransferase
MAKIHPTAVVAGELDAGDDVEIGPYCVVQGRVTLGPGVRLLASVHLQGPVRIGVRTTLFPFVCIGQPAQDFKFKPGDPTTGVRIGSDCLVREYVSIHAATKMDGPTTIGDRVMMMAGSHVGHDCVVGSGVVLVNGAQLAGHCSVGDNVTMSGLTGLHQFTRVGRLAFMSGGSVVSADVPPFCIGWGRNRLMGLNLVGMRRSGMPREHITLLRRAYREVFKVSLPRAEMIQRLEEFGRDCPPALEQAEFVQRSTRPICPGMTARRSRDRVDAGLTEGEDIL